MNNRILAGATTIMLAASLPVWAQDEGTGTRGSANFPPVIRTLKPSNSAEPASTGNQPAAGASRSVEKAQPVPGKATTELQAGLDAYRNKDYAGALKLLAPLAKQGDASAQLKLGVMNEMGEGVAQSYPRAAVRYRQAADQGNAEAQYRLGEKYELGQGVPRNNEVAAEWYRKSSAQGYVLAQAKVGADAKSAGAKSAEPAAAKIPDKVATPLQAVLDAYQKGDYAAAIKLLLPLANKGDAAAQLSVGLMNEMGQGVPQNYQKAIERYRQAALQGNAEAQYRLAEKYEFGQGVPQDKKTAAEWYGKSAAQGNTGAQAKLITVQQTKAADLARTAEEGRQRAEARSNAEQAARASSQAQAMATAKALAAGEGKKAEPPGMPAETNAAKPVKAEKAEPMPVPAGSPKILVERSVKDWAAAWSSRNVEQYLAAYVPAYKPEGLSHSTWKKQRMERISKAKVIEVVLRNINVSALDDGQAIVSFTQQYRSDEYRDQVEKTLRLVKQLDRWLIAEETAGNALATDANSGETRR